MFKFSHDFPELLLEISHKVQRAYLITLCCKTFIIIILNTLKTVLRYGSFNIPRNIQKVFKYAAKNENKMRHVYVTHC